ncbi:hypothetical protein [Flavobacterium luteum]|uniref:Uncharacterized protein n=1 Tax=Flavobacterium luteum TaxID=2026654 RepID=A0A7J5AER7_9FLAO|nr:hypothetical protein [Flavobacterium luteum]KAB1156087.1 hypothetical protein F6464_07760 [Flavobacterium luteum]
MITDKIKALFNFIEFLHSNIENFKQYDILINELNSLDIERNKLNRSNNFKDKLKYDEIQAEIKDKFEVINENIILLIKDKSNELNICDWNETNTLWNRNILEISELKENFSANDIAEILEHKNKYIEYRTKTNCYYFSQFFFVDLDQILKVLFDFFKESTENENEFEAFEIKKIKVNDISEAVELIQKGHTKFIIPTPDSNTKQRLSKSLSDINFFQIYFETNNKKEFNNDSFITPENWNNLKDVFFKQRMNNYKLSYTQKEKIILEIETIENLTLNNTDYKILKERYKEYLNELLAKQNQIIKLTDFEKSELFKNTAFFYTSTHFNKDNLKGVFNKEYETKKEFVKILYSENTRIFFRYAITLKNEDFIKSIQNEFKLFCAYNNANNETKENWLKHTYHYIINVNELSGFIDKPTVSMVIEWYNETIKSVTPEAHQKLETNKPDEVKNLHPKHNPNDWNTDCFELFKYLIDNYYNDKKRTKTKLICIWFYLSEYNTEKYNLKITKDNYKIFIKENYEIAITNTDKPDNYDSKVLNTLHEHRIKFEDSLK